MSKKVYYQTTTFSGDSPRIHKSMNGICCRIYICSAADLLNNRTIAAIVINF